MLIINADDWGRSATETDAALACHRLGRVTSVSAMVFMDDSKRAAQLAREEGVDAGLHLNLSQCYTHPSSSSVAAAQEKLVRFMTRSKYALLLYQPRLRKCFRDVYQAQIDEFADLYGKPPSHVDGHQHRHLCANILVDQIIPRGSKVRRNFTFWPGEKGIVNRAYRSTVDRWLARRYRTTDFFFSLERCLKTKSLGRVVELAKTANVEVMTHPVRTTEQTWLTSGHFAEMLQRVQIASYTLL